MKIELNSIEILDINEDMKALCNDVATEHDFEYTLGNVSVSVVLSITDKETMLDNHKLYLPFEPSHTADISALSTNLSINKTFLSNFDMDLIKTILVDYKLDRFEFNNILKVIDTLTLQDNVQKQYDDYLNNNYELQQFGGMDANSYKNEIIKK